MNSWKFASIFLLLFSFSLWGVQSSPSKKTSATPPRKEKEPETAEVSKSSTKEGVQMQWFGHSFVYLTSQNGIRVAMDPFTESIKLPFPRNLHADVVLISYEGIDRDAGERLYGASQIFRSVTGVGANSACGIIFRGVGSFRDSTRGRELGKNTVFVFELDGIRFCHLGGLGYPLDTRKIDEIGRVDVVFLPVGNMKMTASEWRVTAEKLQAKWIIPIAFRNEKAGLKDLRPLEEFVEEVKLHQEEISLKNAESNMYVFRREDIPSQPTLLILPSP